MASDLLQKEEEYRKLNEELQSRNKKLMEEFDNVMLSIEKSLVQKKQDNLLKESMQNETKFDYLKLIQRRSSETNYKFDEAKGNFFMPNRNTQFDVATKENFGDNDKINLSCVPDSVDQMGVKGMTHFYRAKIKAMQNEYNQLQQDCKNKCEEIKKVQKENVKLIEDKDKWFQAYNSNKTNVSKLENQITTLNSKCQSKENENASLKKEIEQLKKDLKSLNLNASGHEIRLNRALEENEKMKTTLKVVKQEEKELKDGHRKEVTELTTAVKRLEKHKTELLSAFKKQLQLVDNLKQQKAYLEASKLTQISESEFMRILDWKLDN